MSSEFCANRNELASEYVPIRVKDVCERCFKQLASHQKLVGSVRSEKAITGLALLSVGKYFFLLNGITFNI